ncbi:filamentous hemagglutinin N-terminal domain-containing protein [bacterium]|nr:filamentous hemagglutinin N-terminal domain-containing protein [bacterium]
MYPEIFTSIRRIITFVIKFVSVLVFVFVFIFLISHQWVFSARAYAQIAFDGTLGLYSDLSGPDYVIMDTMGKQVGANLFHSFREFNVRSGETATFAGHSGIENIIGRVTGGTASWIDGIIRSTITNADLYLINPSGVLFGPNAQIDISGSFHATTADYIRLGEKGRFDAARPDQSLLSVDPPSAFGFLCDDPAGISIDGASLETQEGEALSLVGGDLEIVNGVCHAKSGQINLISVSSRGEVLPDDSDKNLDSFARLGDIRMSNDSSIEVSGEDAGRIIIRGGRFEIANSYISSTVQAGEGEGRIDIGMRDELLVTRGGEIKTCGIEKGKSSDILIDTEKLTLANNGTIKSGSSGYSQGGDIHISAGESIEISGDFDAGGVHSGVYLWGEDEGDAGDLLISSPNLAISGNAKISGENFGSGLAPDISVDVENLKITGGGNIDNSSLDQGRGGDVTVKAKGSISIWGAGEQKSGIYSHANGSGNAGAISVQGSCLIIGNEGIISGETYPDSEGRGADVVIDVEDLVLTKGGEIAINAYGSGQSGDIMICAWDSILISGSQKGSTSGIGSEARGEGDAGSVSIKTSRLTIKNGGIISGVTDSEGRGGDILMELDRLEILDGYISASCLKGSSGEGGDITISASESIMISHLRDGPFSVFGLFSMTGGSGNAGNIFISTPYLTVHNGGQISSSTVFGSGSAGKITVQAGTVEITHGSQIDSSTNESDGCGGDIMIVAEDSVFVSGSRIKAITGGDARAGSIDIETPLLVIADGGIIETLAGEFTNGNAGNISLKVKDLKITDDGLINSSSLGSGNGGNISVLALDNIYVSNMSGEGSYAGICSLASSDGDAGGISLSAGYLMLSGDGSCIMASTLGKGKGGTIRISVDDLQLYDRANIMADSSDTGNAGDIIINAADAIYCEGSFITTEAKCADGGNIQIHAQRLVDLKNSQITTSVKGGAGNGGNIMIDPVFVILNKSRIIADAEAGRGGNINIVCDVFVSSSESIVRASSRLGIDGIVEIDAPVVDISGRLAVLPDSLKDFVLFFPKQCAEREDDEESYLIISGRQGFPPIPGGLWQAL